MCSKCSVKPSLSLSATHCIWLVQVGGVTEMHICSRWNRRLLIAVCWRHASVRAKQLDCTRGACSVAHRCRSLVSLPLLLPQFEHPADKWEVRSKGGKSYSYSSSACYSNLRGTEGVRNGSDIEHCDEYEQLLEQSEC